MLGIFLFYKKHKYKNIKTLFKEKYLEKKYSQ